MFTSYGDKAENHDSRRLESSRKTSDGNCMLDTSQEHSLQRIIQAKYNWHDENSIKHVQEIFTDK